MNIIPYINLAGNAEEAMRFYKEIFGGETEIMRWSEMPPDPKMTVGDNWQNKVMHGSLKIREGVSIYLADSLMGEEPAYRNNVFLHMEFDSEEELRKVHAALAEGGTIKMPLDKMFWGALYGDLIDKYGIGWGLHYQISD